MRSLSADQRESATPAAARQRKCPDSGGYRDEVFTTAFTTSSTGSAADSFRSGEFTSTRPTITIGWVCGCTQGSATRWIGAAGFLLGNHHAVQADVVHAHAVRQVHHRDRHTPGEAVVPFHLDGERDGLSRDHLDRLASVVTTRSGRGASAITMTSDLCARLHGRPVVRRSRRGRRASAPPRPEPRRRRPGAGYIDGQPSPCARSSEASGGGGDHQHGRVRVCRNPAGRRRQASRQIDELHVNRTVEAVLPLRRDGHGHAPAPGDVEGPRVEA